MWSKLTGLAKYIPSEDDPIDESKLKKAAEGITDTGGPARIGVMLLVGCLLAFFAWAFLAPLDEGVPSSGTVTVESKRKIVQHLTGGIIKEILVNSGISIVHHFLSHLNQIPARIIPRTKLPLITMARL